MKRIAIAFIVAALAVALLGLDEQGVRTVGEVPAGLPALTFPGVPQPSTGCARPISRWALMRLRSRSSLMKRTFTVSLVPKQWQFLTGFSTLEDFRGQMSVLHGTGSTRSMGSSGGR